FKPIALYDDLSSNAHAAAVSRTEAATSRNLAVFPSRRFLRTLLRRRSHRIKGAPNNPHGASQGAWRSGADVRGAASFGRKLHRATGPQGLPRRNLRTNRSRLEDNQTRPPRSGADHNSRHADRPATARRSRSCVPGRRVQLRGNSWRSVSRYLNRRISRHAGNRTGRLGKDSCRPRIVCATRTALPGFAGAIDKGRPFAKSANRSPALN